MIRSTAQAVGATLAHRLAIEELNATVAACLDHQDYAALEDAFTAEALYVSGPRKLVGPREIIEFFVSRKESGGPRTTRHMGSGLRLEFNESATSARGASIWVSYASNTVAPVDHLAIFMVADFEDRYVLGGDGFWRIGERVIRPVFKNAEAAPKA